MYMYIRIANVNSNTCARVALLVACVYVLTIYIYRTWRRFCRGENNIYLSNLLLYIERAFARSPAQSKAASLLKIRSVCHCRRRADRLTFAFDREIIIIIIIYTCCTDDWVIIHISLYPVNLLTFNRITIEYCYS